MNEKQVPFDTDFTPPEPPKEKHSFFPAENRETRLAWILAIIGMILADMLLYGGFQLGFALCSAACIVVSTGYLLRSGAKFTPYTGALLGLSLVIAGSFLRSDDGFVKFVMTLFLLLSTNLGLCLLAKQNRRDSGSLLTLLDAGRAQFALGIGGMEQAWWGLDRARRLQSAAGKKRGAVLAGLGLSVPILAVLIFLLMRADAAFEGLMDLLPEMNLGEPLLAVLIGLPLGFFLYTRATALHLAPKAAPARWQGKTMNPVTLTTVLAAVCAVYAVYLCSQLAYFVGGFSGILPQEYTLAEYARRGFFEMAWLSAINLGIIALAMALSGEKATSAIRYLCLFIGIVTLFLVIAASAKMLLYIDAYGLTRLRVLTEVIMIFLALTAGFACIRLFLPKFAYMKAVILCALILGAVTAWADVDTVVAAYNVSAYQSGRLETVDMRHLGGLSDGAVPYIARLTEDADPEIAQKATDILSRTEPQNTDLRGWNLADALSAPYWQRNASGSVSDSQ